MTAAKKKPVRKPATTRTAPSAVPAVSASVTPSESVFEQPSEQPKYAEPTMEDVVANLRANGNDSFADQIEANAKAAAEMIAQMDISADIADDESESEDAEIESGDSDIPVDTNPTLKGEWHQYRHAEVIALIAGALTGKSEEWSQEAALESLKGAADRSKIDTLRWGARQLLEIAAIVVQVPEGEVVFPEPPVEAAAE